MRAGCPRSKMNRIVIVGFMACGKTTVARALAERLNCEMIDLDSFIADREAQSPAEIIQTKSENEFREIETRALRDVLEQNNARVIALGGGAWTIDVNRELVNQHGCLSVWMDTPFELCWQRITSGGNEPRPLAPDRESAQKLYDDRRATYQLASLRFRVGEADTAKTLANRILTET
jgi:shikimate kinase